MREALERFARDRVWNAYAIADLDEPFRQYASVDVEGKAALLILRHPGFVAITTHGPARGVAALLGRADLPRHAHFLVRLSHRRPLERGFAVDGHEMLRMSVGRRSFRRSPQSIIVPERLSPSDGPTLEDLYAAYPETAYHPDQLGDGVFYGVRDAGGNLLAACGTHVVSRAYRVAAVGNVYTRPEARGRGLAQAVTAATVADLLDRYVDLVALNVAPDNVPARRVYERLGFRVHCRYWEGEATLRDVSSPAT